LHPFALSASFPQSECANDFKDAGYGLT